MQILHRVLSTEELLGRPAKFQTPQRDRPSAAWLLQTDATQDGSHNNCGSPLDVIVVAQELVTISLSFLRRQGCGFRKQEKP